MSKRREGREAAVQYLYQLDLHGTLEQQDPAPFWNLRSGPGKAPVPAKTRAFAEQLAAGVVAHRAEIDACIQKYTANYAISRLAAVDRSILRVAIFEMLHSPDVAPVIVINEAIEIAKKFGTEKSGGFVNGILDRVKQELGRPARGSTDPRGQGPGVRSQNTPASAPSDS